MTKFYNLWINQKNCTYSSSFSSSRGPKRFTLILVIIVIRTLIRPGALAGLLTANIIAGHPLTLLGNYGSTLNIVLLNILLIIQFLFLLLELSVVIIQSYASS